MEALLLYILKSAGILSLFYLSYLLLLKNDTSFVSNRRFLLGGIIAAIILPAVHFTKKVIIEAPVASAEFIPVTSGLTPLPVEQVINWWQLTAMAYLMVLAFLLVRFCKQLFRIFHLINTHPHTAAGEFRCIETPQVCGPFSFFNYIVFNPKSYSEKELELILLHEKVHARQYHSLDILLGNLASCFLWFHPLSWYYKKSIVQNLEYIADRETVTASASKKEYIQTLIKVTLGDLQPALTNSFYQSFIKKRIVMLNKKSTTNNLWKISLVFPLVLAFILVFNVKTEASILPTKAHLETGDVDPSEFQQEQIEANFTPTTSRAKLEEYKKIFAEKNIALETDQVEYSADNLKRIRVKFTLPEGGSQEYVSRTTDEGNLIPFKLTATFDPEGKVNIFFDVKGTRKGENEIDRKVGNGIIPPQSQNKNDRNPPIYIINGKSIENESIVNALDPEKINKIEVLKGASATVIYGSSGANGAVLITTKKVKDSSDIKTGNLIKKNTVKGSIILGPKNQYSDKPLIVVDGKEKQADFEMKDIDPESIKSVNVIKGEGAVEKYGENAKVGVIEIITKSGTTASQP